MTKTIKIILVIFVSVICLAIAFISGVRSSFSFYMPSFEKQMSVQTLERQSLIEKLDKNEIENAKKTLRLQLDGDILALAQLIEESKDNERKTKMKKLLIRISSHREKYKAFYVPIDVVGEHNLKEANSKIEEILNKYKR